MFSDSNLSVNHISNEEMNSMRTSSTCATFFNLIKCYFGIAALSYARFIANNGVFTALIGVCISVSINAYSVWLITKARNRFKKDKIVSLIDLGVKIYGQGVEIPMVIIQMLGALMYLFPYNKFFG